jgi:hypothetical protein
MSVYTKSAERSIDLQKKGGLSADNPLRCPCISAGISVKYLQCSGRNRGGSNHTIRNRGGLLQVHNQSEERRVLNMWKVLMIAVVVWVIVGAVRKSRHQYPAFNWRVLAGIGIGWTALRILLAVITAATMLKIFGFLVLMEMIL